VAASPSGVGAPGPGCRLTRSRDWSTIAAVTSTTAADVTWIATCPACSNDSASAYPITVNVPVHTSPLATLTGTSRRNPTPELPTTMAITARVNPLKRPRNKALRP